MRILIATDAWHPQVNGVVRTLTSLARAAAVASPRHRRRPRHHPGRRGLPDQGCALLSYRPRQRFRFGRAARNGKFVTLRLTSRMYHRFHAPHDCHIERVTLIHGDAWNVNPIALKRVERLFCKNERAVIRTR